MTTPADRTWDIDRSAHVVAPFTEPTAFDEAWWSSKRAFKETYMHLGDEAFKSDTGAAAFLMAHLVALLGAGWLAMLPLALVGEAR